MNNDTDYRVLCEQLWSKLPTPLPRERIEALYGDAIDRMVKQAAEALSRPAAADLVVSVLRKAGSRVLRIVSHAADVVAEALPSLPGVGMQPAFATRALGAARPGASRVQAFRNCGAARLRVLVETAKSGENVRLRLEADAGKSTVPFDLTMIDDEEGKVLLADKHFKSGEAVVRDVDPGTYQFRVETDDAETFLVLRIEPI